MDDGVVKQENSRFLSPQRIIEQAGIRIGAAVADFGCGQGDFVLAAARVVGAEGKVSAIDIQDSALSSTRSKTRIEGLLNVDLTKANVEVYGSTKLADASQDAVLLTNLLFQTEKKKDVIKETARVMKQGGIAVFVDWKKGVPMGPSHPLRAERTEVEKLMEQGGFVFQKDIDAGMFHFGMTFIKQ